MEAITVVTIFVIEISVLLIGTLGIAIGDICQNYSEHCSISYDVAETMYVVGDLIAISALFALIIFMIGGVIIYHFFDKRYSWLSIIPTKDDVKTQETTNAGGYCAQP